MKLTKELIRELVLEVLKEAQFGQKSFEKGVGWSMRTDDPDAPADSPEDHTHWLKKAKEAGVDEPIQGQEGFVLPPSPRPSRPGAQEPTKLARRKRPRPKVRVP